MTVPLVKTEFEPRGGYRVESAPAQTTTYPYPYYYGYGVSSYAPMFIDLLFSMLFLMLPLMLIVPIFKSLTKAFAG